MAEPNEPKKSLLDAPFGGFPSKGRPTGSVNIASKRASKKLEALGFDPIEKMVELYKKLERDIETLQYDEDGLPKDKFPALALSQLMASQQRCVSELLRYGYARSTEATEVNTQAIAPITIQLSSTPNDFDTSVIGVDREDTYKGNNE